MEMEKQMSTPQTSSINVTSNHFSDHIDATFIRMVKTLAVEYSIQIDPDAKEMGRNIIQDKMNSIIPPESKEIIKKFNKIITDGIKNKHVDDSIEFVRLAYQVSKIIRIDNV